MDEDMIRMADEFITGRISYHGKNEAESLSSAYMDLRSRVDLLRETLTEAQIIMLRGCENAYHIADGETGRFYYTAGFRDAIRFLLNFGEDNQ